MTQHVTEAKPRLTRGGNPGPSEETLSLKPDILLIEDEPLVSALVRRYLSGVQDGIVNKSAPGHQLNVTSLESGFDLLKADLSSVKVAIVDLLLPQITGVDLIRHFRKCYPQMGIIAISGMATDSMKRQLRELMHRDFKFLNKPLRKEEFFDAFERAWKYNKESLKNSEQHRLTDPALLKEGEEELWTVVRVPEKQNAIIAVERRGLSRKKVVA